MANIILDATKSTGVSSTVVLNTGDTITLQGFELSEAQQVFVNELGQLAIVLTDGTQFLVTNFAQNLADNPDAAILISESGEEVTYSDVIAQFIDNTEQEVEPALGPETAAAPQTTGVASATISEGSNAAENFDLYGAGFGLGEVVTSEEPAAEAEAQEQIVAAQSSPDVNPISSIAPAAANTSVSGAEDTTFALNIPAPTDADSDDSTLTIVLTNIPSASEGEVRLGGVAVTAGQVLTPTELTSLTFVPATDYNGTTTLNFNVIDELNQITPSSHSITITAVSDDPVFTGPSTLNVSEDSAAVNLNLDVPTDADTPYGDVLTVSITTPLSGIDGTITLDGNPIIDSQTFTTEELARLQFTPDLNFNGTINIAYEVQDSSGTTVTNTHTITVNPVNDAPTVVDSTSSQAEDSVAIDLNIPAPTDIEGDTLTITFTSPLPTDGTMYYADGTTVVGILDNLTVAQLTGLRFTPNADFNGDITISYLVTDGTDTSTATHTVTITSVNDAPVANDSTSSQDEDTTDITLSIPLPTDVDDTSLLASIATLPTDGVLKFANGTSVTAGVQFAASELAGLTFTPNADFNGSVAINYTVEDDEGATDTATHTITVNSINDAPVTTNSTSSQDEDTTAIDLNITAPTDVDGDTLTITLDALPTEGTIYYADGTTPVLALANLTVAELTSLKFTPNANYNGTVTLNYTVNDGTTTTGGTHTITVNSIEDTPIVTNSTSIQDEDSVDITLGIPLPTDGDGDTLYATIAVLPTDGTLEFADGSLVPAGTQFLATELPGITFTPNTNYLGTVVINYTVTDNNTAPQAATHTITVNNTPDAPVVTDSSSTQDEDSVGVDLGIPAPTDPDGDVLTTIVTLPTDGTLYYADGTTPVGVGASLTVAELTSLKFTPNANFNGTVAINYVVSDGDGATADVNGTHTITVTSINDAPVVVDSSSTQVEDSVDVALGIGAPTDVEGDTMQFRITAVNDGTVKLADGTTVVVGTLYDVAELTGLTFTPNTNFDGTVTIDYEVNDGTDAVTATHTVTVTGVNDAPVVTNSSSTQDEDSVGVDLGIPAPTDPENDSLTTIVSLPAEGTVYYADGTTPVGVGDNLTVAELTSLKFTPNANFNGTVTINYTVDDGALTTIGTHTVTVNSINDLPVVTNSTSTQAEDTTDVDINIPVATDVDGDVLRFVVATLPTEGTFTFSDGSPLLAGTSYPIADIATLRFTPNSDFNGTVTLNYTVADGVGADVAGTHTIDVTAVNDSPVVVDSTSSQDEDTSATLGIPLPTDIDGDSLIANIATLPTDGTLYFSNGTAVQAGVDFNATELPGITFTPNLNYNGTVVINYTVTDTFSTPEAATHTITVNPVADTILVASGDLDDNVNVLDFTNIIRLAEIEDCVTPGTYKLDAEYQYNTVLAGSSYNYDLPSSTFIATDGSPMTYSATYTYNGTTSIVPTSGSSWVTINPLNGDLSGQFPSSMNGFVTFTFTAVSADGATATKTLTYNVLSQAEFNSIDVIGTMFGNYLLPENTSDNIMMGVNEAGVLRYDLITTGRGITANLEEGYVDKQNGYTDLVDGVRELQATNYADTITAENGKASYIYANGGNDTVVSSTSHDYLYGGSGTDTLSYANTGAVSVNLGSNYSSRDTISSFENVIGSAGNDTITGSSGNNYIDGGAGVDRIYAGAGNDTIIYDENDAVVDGGSGYDKLVVADQYTSTGNTINLNGVTGIEEINMDNSTFSETLEMNVASMLSSASGKEIFIKGDRLMDFEGATEDDVVQMTDKTASEINAAESGTKVVGDTRYEIYDFGSQGTLYVEFGLDILDSSGTLV